MYKAGISYEEFGKLNMRQIRYIAKAYAEKIEEDFKIADTTAFIQGRYMVEALLSTVGNMLGGKNSNFKYPEQPYTMNKREEELTEEEIEAQRDTFFANLRIMQHNFEASKQEQK